MKAALEGRINGGALTAWVEKDGMVRSRVGRSACRRCDAARMHACTHAHTHARTRARTHARTHANTHKHARTRTHAHTHKHARTRMHARTHRHARAHTHARACTHARIHTCTLTCTHARARTQARTLTMNYACSCGAYARTQARMVLMLLLLTTIACFTYTWGYAEVGVRKQAGEALTHTNTRVRRYGCMQRHANTHMHARERAQDT